MAGFNHVIDNGAKAPAAQDYLPVHVATLEPNILVFGYGEPKRFVYRLESGLIRCCWPDAGTAEGLTEELGPGTVFGSGFLEEHSYEATAARESKVTCWTRSALPFLEQLDPRTRQRWALETEREFVIRRNQLVATAPTTPYRRLAGFLCIASRINASQGRDPCLIDESVECASVGALLKMDLETLGSSLVELRNRGLVVYAPPRSLRIVDLEALQSLADADAPTLASKSARHLSHA